jgi:hypothetical protein
MADSFEDFCRKYQDTFVILDKSILAFCAINGDELHLVTKDHGKIILKASPKTFDRISNYFPQKGLYNINDRIVFFVRTARRQWKRGLCSGNSSLKPIIYFEINPAFNVNTIHQLFYPEYPPSLDKALTIPRWKSIALSLNFGITLSEKEKYDATLWYNQTIIGYISQAKKQIHLVNDLFQNEVKEYLTNTEGLSWNLQILGQSAA